jgi:cystathionine beta-lyase/cystathionine gamma-synthase
MSEDVRGLGPSTRAVHAGEPPTEVGTSVVNPIFQTTTFHSDPSGAGEVLYTRYGNNPNHRRVEERLCALEGTADAVVTGSGMGAMVAALLASVRAGDHVLAAEALYGGTRVLLERELGRLGIESSFVDFLGDGWRDAVRPNTRVFLLETLSNPLLRFTDPASVADVAHEAGAVVIVDATFTPGPNLRTADRGVDLVVHSATKYMGGHTDVTAGAVCGSAELIRGVRARAAVWGAMLDPHAAWLLERGMKTLPLRLQRHNENGMALAEWCARQPGIARVHYPGLPTHPDHARAAELLAGFGGMLSIELKGGGEAATRFVRGLRLATLAPSLGGVETLVSEPRFTSHVALTPEERARQGIGDGFIRLSLGIEDSADLIADLQQALASAA